MIYCQVQVGRGSYGYRNNSGLISWRDFIADSSSVYYNTPRMRHVAIAPYKTEYIESLRNPVQITFKYHKCNYPYGEGSRTISFQ